MESLLSRRGPFDDLQHPLAGAHGYASQTAEGTLQGGAPFVFRLTDAPPFSAAFHVVGLTELDAPFKGGVLVPSPNLLNGPLPVAADGTLELAGPWLTGLPAGLELYLQFWWADAGGPKGCGQPGAACDVAVAGRHVTPHAVLTVDGSGARGEP